MQLKDRIKQIPAFYAAVFLLLLVGFGLRLFQLEQYPLGVNQDELSNIYDGYAIAQTGADRWGQHFPVILRGFGTSDYRPPLYAWLSAATIQLFGFSVFSGRLVSAVVGCASLVLVGLVAKRLGGKLFAFFAILLAAFSPWHILFSRIASEGAMLPPFFLISACYLWQRARASDYQPRYMALVGLCVGLGTNTYQAAKLVSLLFAILFAVDFWLRHPKSWNRIALFGASCLVGASPQIIALATMPDQFFSRARGTAEPFSFSYDYFNAIAKNIASNFSPDFLFFDFKEYNNLSLARLLAVECLPFYIGLFFLVKIIHKNQAIKPAYVYMLLLMAVLPSAITHDNPHALRSSGLTVLLPLVTAAGLVFMYRSLNRPALKNAFIALATGLIVWNSVFFIKSYANSEELRGANMQVLLVEATKRINERKGYFEHTYIENFGNQPYIYVLTFCDIKPADFQRANKKFSIGSWDDFKAVNNYYFLSRDEIEEKLKQESAESLILLKAKTPKYQLIDSVQYLDDKVYFYYYTKKA